MGIHRFSRGARPLARAFALCAIYEWLVTGEDMSVVDSNILTLVTDGLDADDFAKCDKEYYRELIVGISKEKSALENEIAAVLDRDLARVSFVERSVLLIAVYEMKNRLEVPYKVIINEAVQLAKVFGGNDGYKYVNGVLDKLAHKLRPDEMKA